jgi:CRP-like cAMP-binding protein
VIYSPADAADYLFCIKEGSVKIGCYNEKGREITKFVFYKNELFGEQAIAGLKKRRDYAFAIEDTVIQKIDCKAINDFITSDLEVSRYFLNLFGKRNISLDERLESLVFKDSKTRIIDYLLKIIEQKGKKVGFEIVVRSFMTHQEIANLTSTSRQTVTTVLNILKNQNIITFDRHRLLVRDIERLKSDVC